MSESRNSKVEYVYDPKTGSWVPASVNPNSSPDDKSTNPSDSDTNSVDDSSSNVNSTKEAEKEFIEIELNTLTGDLTLTPSEKSIRIKVNDTIRIEGIGRYLSGLYFVSSVKRTIGSDGYSHSFTLLKNGFGSSIKQSQATVETRKDEVSVQSSDLKEGDSVKIVGDDAVYSNASDGVRVPDWVKKKTLTVRQVSDDKTRVLLMPIYSWTYVKYVQKI